ncbi:hypothetical protein PLESTB_000020100 [Pleodorina starrii]|uniref:Uncharacterized protein n=1 Tax=Pleodorina starrii TaxID=330485 RepID=A0A9W6B8M8_9CHLO|nr:hypothetical protein PLESTM_001114700 [Pleodorina starrii]GLC47734.1 hypothetical protein PLESTB_000020100 [Pleodorina starrii]GLC70854.1 hypothetical protein PLESTF_001040100 [Pleodorina starrii]
MFAGMCYFVPDWLRCLWAPSTQLHIEQYAGQIAIDILSPRACPMEAPLRGLWRPCPSPAILIGGDDSVPSEEQAQRPCPTDRSPDLGCFGSASEALEPTSACCSSEGSSSWSDSFDSPHCSEGGSEGAVAVDAADDTWDVAREPAAGSEEEPLLRRGTFTARSGAPCAAGSCSTPPSASRVRAFASGFNSLCGGASPSPSRCGGFPPGDYGLVTPQPATESKSSAKGSACVPPADIDGLLASVVAGTLWQDDE